ncbi:MAG: response regulator [Verrucomicrobiota bacterium]
MARILVVDDEDPIRETLEALLRHAGHKVVVAVNGEEAVKLHRQAPVDLMITDIHMPEKEGLTTIMDLHRGTPRVKIIAMTGSTIKDYLNWARKLGARRTIAKPFSGPEILQLVEEVLNSPDEEEESDGKKG